jgi:hypothetical protein
LIDPLFTGQCHAVPSHERILGRAAALLRAQLVQTSGSLVGY